MSTRGATVNTWVRLGEGLIDLFLEPRDVVGLGERPARGILDLEYVERHPVGHGEDLRIDDACPAHRHGPGDA